MKAANQKRPVKILKDENTNFDFWSTLSARLFNLKHHAIGGSRRINFQWRREKVWFVRRMVCVGMLTLATFASLFVSSFSFFVRDAQAATGIAHSVNYQGRLLNKWGVNVNDGTYQATFRLYSLSTGGSQLWSASTTNGLPTGTAAAVNITVKNGLFSILLGDASGGQVAFPEGLFDNDTLYLGVKIGADSEMTPRKRLSAVPYAYNSETLQGQYASHTVDNTGGNLFALNLGSTDAATAKRTAFYVHTSGTSNTFDYLIRGNSGTDVFTVTRQGNVTTTGNFEVDGYTRIGDSTSDRISVASRFVTDLMPAVDTTYSLGSSSLRWKNLFVTNVSSTNIDATGYVSTTKLFVNGSQILTANPNLQQVTDQGYFTTNSIGFAGASSTGNIIPTANNAYSLGSLSYAWQNVYASGTYYGQATNITRASAVTNGEYAFYISGSSVASPNATVNLSRIDFTPSGSKTVTHNAQGIYLYAGYTGGGAARAEYLYSGSAATGTSFAMGYGNYGGMAYLDGTGTQNVGYLGTVKNGTYNFGLVGNATTNKNGGTNIGVIGLGLNAGTTPIQVGGYFALRSGGTQYSPTLSGALIADNGAQTSPILRLQDNGTDVMTVIDGGNVGIGTANPYLFKLTVAGSVAPSTTGIYDLGGLSNYWRNIYATSTVYAKNLSASFNLSAGTTTFRGVTYTWPDSIVANKFLKVDAFGNFSWATAASGGTTSTLQDITDNGNVTNNAIGVAGVSSTGDVLPTTNNLYNLGSASNYWHKLFVKNVSSTNIDALGYVSTTKLWVNGSQMLTANPNLQQVTDQGYFTTHSIGFAGASSTGHIIPTTNNLYSLGSASKSWQNIYASGTAYLPTIIAAQTASGTNMGELINSTAILTGDVSGAYRAVGIGSVIKTHLKSGVIDSKYILGAYSSLLRDQADDQGTLATSYGQIITSGHYGATSRTTNNIYGIDIENYTQGGTIGNLYSIYIAPTIGAGAAVGHEYGVYAADPNMSNIFMGNVGIGTDNPYLFKLTIAGTIAPSTTNSYDLGASSYYWRNLFVKNVSSSNIDAVGYVSTTKLWVNGSQMLAANPNLQQVTDQGAVTNRMITVNGITTTGSIFAGSANAYDIGATTTPFKAIYVNELFLSGNSLYMNGKKVLESLASVMNFTADSNQTLQVQTSGSGNLQFDSSGSGNVLFTTTGSGNVSFSSINQTQITSANSITQQTSNPGANIVLNTLGANSQIMLNAVEEIDLTTPFIDINGNTSMSGTLTLGLDPVLDMQAATKHYVDQKVGSSTSTLQQVTDRGYVTTNPIRVNGVSSTANILPTSNNAYDLGSSANYWRKLFVKNVSSTNIDALGYVSTTKLWVNGSQILSANPNLQQVTNQGYFTNKSIGFAGASSTGNIIPTSNNSYDLGSTAKSWQSIYASSTIYGHVNGSGNALSITNSANKTFFTIGGGAPLLNMTADAYGIFYNGQITTARLGITSDSAGIMPMVARGAVAQTAELQQWQSNAGARLAAVDKNGTFFFSGASSTGSILPTITNSYDLGSSSNYWRKLFAKNVSSTNIDALGYVSTTNLYVSGLYANDVLGIPAAAKNPTGFTNRTDSFIYWVDGTRTFSIGPKSPATSYTYYIAGLKYTKSSTSTVTIPNTEGVWFFYFIGGTLTASQTQPEYATYPMVSNGYWSVTQQKLLALAEERHGITMDPATHEYLHHTVGTRYSSGLTLTGNTAGSGNANGDAQVALTNGEIFDEDLGHNITNSATPGNFFEQILTPTSSIPVYFRKGSSADNWEKKTATYYPVYDNTGTRISYNLLTGNTWSTTTIPNTNFMAVWLFATNNVHEPIIAVIGQRQDGTLANAQANNTFNTLSFGNLPFQEMKVLYRLIFQSTTAYTNAVKARLRDIQDLRSVSNLPAGTYVATSHSSLTGLLNDDHTQYFLLAGRTSGQVANGGLDPGGNLTLDSTA
ncbi:MAG: hypothetical protein PHH26_01805, partial [Candidatus Thermoplasmatota archaeon]|nr:hypothetical protein [Candidatus Thermoplasmatota archaeon]